VPARLLGDRVVLVVDDNDLVCHMTARILVEAGCRALEAHSAQAALDLLDRLGSRMVGLVVSDIAMPGLSGFELADRISERWPGVPVLLVSGEPGRRDDLPGPFLGKPFSPEQLVAAAEAVLREGKGRLVEQ
jgi:DNA-binding response OmpR family regulator